MPDVSNSAVGVDATIACDRLGPALDALVDVLGFRLDTIMPADDPTTAIVSGHGLRLRLDAGDVGDVGTDAPGEPPALAELLEVTRPDGGDGGVGRAGMRYRDLLPSRRGGRVIASHITIPDGGPVPDYVHHHEVRYQSIHCVRGWVRVVYEDQGPPFTLEAGDCVLQPPGIRHRVLESSPGLEVVEIGAPAAHPTHVDHDLALPTPDVRPDRAFGAGQRFVRHRAVDAVAAPWRGEGFESSETAIGEATDGLAGTRSVRSTAPSASTPSMTHDGELRFWYVVDGTATLHVDGRIEPLAAGAAVAVPAGVEHRLADADGLELLEVTMPAAPPASG